MGVIPGLVVLGYIRKQSEEAMESKSVSSTLHGLCISPSLQIYASEFLRGFPFVMDVIEMWQADLNPFLPWPHLSMVSYNSTRKLT